MFTMKTAGEKIDYEDALFMICTKMQWEQAYYQNKLLQKAYENRVLDPVLYWNQDLIYRDLNWAKINDRNQARKEELAKVIAALEAQHVEYILIKGMVMNQYYTPSIPRQSNDFDFIIKEPQQFFNIATYLLRRGYDYVYFPVFSQYQNTTVGISKFKKKLNDDTEIYIEINIGGFPIGNLTWFVDEDMWKNTQLIHCHHTNIKVPNDNITLLIFLFEACGRKSVYIRDHVDFYFLSHRADIDWTYVKEKLPDQFLRSVLNYFMTSNKVTRSPNPFVHFSRPFRLSNYMSLYNEVAHIIPFLINSRSVRKIIYYYVSLIGNFLYNQDLFLNAVEKLETMLCTKRKYEMGIPTYFIPLDSDVIGEGQWISAEGHHMWLTPLGTFLASHFCIFKEHKIDMLRNHLEEEYAKLKSVNKESGARYDRL